MFLYLWAAAEQSGIFGPSLPTKDILDRATQQGYHHGLTMGLIIGLVAGIILAVAVDSMTRKRG